MVIEELRGEIWRQLEAAGIESARFETDCLLEQTLACGRQQLLLGRRQAVTDRQAERARSLARRRAQGYPLQYLLGNWEFFGLSFDVGEGVLIPRADTERLCEVAIEQIGEKDAVVADLCSGSGCVAAAVARACPQARLFAVELSQEALPYLRRNLARHAPEAVIVAGDVLQETTAQQIPPCDVILSNPPYLTSEEMGRLQTEVGFEPSLALRGGEDGLLFYRGVTELWKGRLRPGGMLAFEVGIDQHEPVAAILKRSGFTGIEYARDLHGVQRVVYGFYNKEEDHGG